MGLYRKFHAMCSVTDHPHARPTSTAAYIFRIFTINKTHENGEGIVVCMAVADYSVDQ